MLCLDYSNLEERRNINKLYMIARGQLFPVYVLEMNVPNSIFYKRKMFKPKYNWVEIKCLGIIQSQLMLFLDIHSPIVAYRRELERLILILSRKMHSLEISYLQKIKIEI